MKTAIINYLTIHPNCRKRTIASALGVWHCDKEFLDAMDGNISIQTAADQVRQSSRHYAKRQLTWFRRNPAIHWLRRKTGEKNEEIILLARQILREFYN